MIKLVASIFIISLISVSMAAQSPLDSLVSKKLDSVIVEGKRLNMDIERLPETDGSFVYTGRKTELIQIGTMNVNISEKTPRQIFAKVPGIFVYDMDGSGNQINISTRGLDPHRGWEFNNRLNGVITNSDMYGYPASHFSMPMESIEQIKIVRGTGSLQYGAQFGGMINYVSKSADSKKSISWESINSVGSYGLLTTYQAIGGKIGRWSITSFIIEEFRMVIAIIRNRKQKVSPFAWCIHLFGI
jgi:Fe(3+) dicitrate transport protein